jgi:peptidoglycan/xylan/chitin deacetylase (PgdA/CDA1 family)
VNGRAVRWLLALVRGGGSLANGPIAKLTIVRHHRVYGEHERPLYRLGVSEGVFAAQLEMLARAGTPPVSVAEGLGHLESGVPGHRVAMTFDDGYDDNVERALPLLLKHGGRATFYLTAGLMEERRAPWWDVVSHALERTTRPRLRCDLAGRRLDLPLEGRCDRERALVRLLPLFRAPTAERSRRLEGLRAALEVGEEVPCALATWERARTLAEAGMEVGAHTLEHPWLSLLPRAEQEREIAGSIEWIARRLGVRARGLAYPDGDHDAVTIEVARSCGLDHAVTTQAGTNVASTPRFELVRRGLSEGACLGPAGRFSRRLARAELEGVFDRLRGIETAS